MQSLHKKWLAYEKGFSLAMDIFRISNSFPKCEIYSLTDQIRRSSRSVNANLAEAVGKRRYPKHFVAKLTDAGSENFETQTWLDFAVECKYISPEAYQQLTTRSEEVGKLIAYMIRNPTQFIKAY